jgi:NADH dehydrogenase (ubiquinone) Fe-S protein 1
MIKVFVNDIEVYVPNKSSALEACEQIGIEVPRFCFHERLSVAGNCRMCLVEVSKTPKPVASCAFPVMPDMRIYTDTPLVKKARESVLEFLLLNHPLDCPICDQGGECDLQDQAMIFGGDRGRFYDVKRGVQDKNIGPLIKTIMTRCIHCTRCVRFSIEIAGTEDLGTTGRGRETEIGTYLEKTFDSEVSGNIIDLCPVGALTSKPYAFVTRPWELRQIESIDLTDGIGSNINVHFRGTEILRITPRINDDLNEEWISDRARFSYDGLKQQRFLKPFEKITSKNSKFVESHWLQLLPFLENNLEKINNNEANLLTICGSNTDLETLLYFKEFSSNFNSSKIYMEEPLKINSCLPNYYQFSSPISEIDFCDSCLLIGTDPRFEASSVNLRLRKRYRAGNFEIAGIGTNTNLTYPINHLGSSLDNLKLLASGQHDFCTVLKRAKRPFILVGRSIFERNDSEAFLKILDVLRKNTNSKINYLQTEANQVGSSCIGLSTLSLDVLNNLSLKRTPLLVLLINTNSSYLNNLLDYLPLDSLIVAQNSHAVGGFSKASIILPAPAYTEKNGSFLNTEGRLQKTNNIFGNLEQVRDFWQPFEVLNEKKKELICSSRVDLENLLKKEMPFLADFSKNDCFGELNLNFSNTNKVLNTLLHTTVRDFYITETISKTSQTMAACSKLLRKRWNNFKD